MAIWLPAAARDLIAIHQHLSDHADPDHAQRVVTRLLQDAEEIIPEHCPAVSPSARKSVSRNQPGGRYVFLVRQEPRDVLILGCFGPGRDWSDAIHR